MCNGKNFLLIIGGFIDFFLFSLYWTEPDDRHYLVHLSLNIILLELYSFKNKSL